MAITADELLQIIVILPHQQLPNFKALRIAMAT